MQRVAEPGLALRWRLVDLAGSVVVGESHNSERHALGFVEAVRAAFHSLAKSYGMEEVENGLYGVVYRGPSASLTVLHDRLAYELGVAFVPAPAPRAVSYGIVDLIPAADPAAANRYRCFAASSAEAVQTGVTQPVSMLYKYGTPAPRR